MTSVLHKTSVLAATCEPVPVHGDFAVGHDRLQQVLMSASSQQPSLEAGLTAMCATKLHHDVLAVGWLFVGESTAASVDGSPRCMDSRSDSGSSRTLSAASSPEDA